MSIDDYTNRIVEGDAIEVLRELPESSVHTVMTSPPYWGLRDYGVDGQIGLERSLGAYIQSLFDVGDALRRVLRPDGSWWLNLGDTFSGGWGRRGKPEDNDDLHHDDAYPDDPPARHAQLEAKNKLLIPHKVAIALQEAGWVVRADCVWAKPNPMPHSVKDRLTETKEYVFHLTPEPHYWFDLDAVREPHAHHSIERRGRYDFNTSGTPAEACPTRENDEFIGTEPGQALHPKGKNPGDVFDVTVKPFPEAHFAVYPPELVETPVLASCPPEVCAGCGAPYEREARETAAWEVEDPDRPQLERALELAEQHGLTEKHFEACRAKGYSDAAHGKQQTGVGRNTDDVERLAREAKGALGGYFREFVTTFREPGGFVQTCDCDTDETQPGIVLDPFAGAGTTCLVAKRLGRRFIGVDLNPEYVAMAQKRVGLTVEQPELLADVDDGWQPLDAFADGGGAGG